jgi:hypothetical protein
MAGGEYGEELGRVRGLAQQKVCQHRARGLAEDRDARGLAGLQA